VSRAGPGARPARPYARRLPFMSSVGLNAAIVCTFCSVGFISDLFNFPRLTPVPTVLCTAFMSGVIAFGAVLSVSRGPRWLATPLVASGVLVALENLAFPVWFGHAVPATSLEQLASHAKFDALGCMLTLVGGYILYILFITRQGSRQMRLDAEFALAREVHQALVPAIARQSARLEWWGRSDPSTEVGGDLIDVIESDDATLAVIADVSGHGVSAGMLTAMTRSAIRTRVGTPWTIASLLEGVDRLVLGLERPGRFVTAACARFERGAADVALAGHLPVLIARATGALERVENQRPPLGIPFAAPFPTARVAAASGDLFVLFTDGLTEARDARGDEWGVAGIEAVLRAHAREPLDRIATAIFEGSRRFGASGDDRSLLMIRVR